MSGSTLGYQHQLSWELSVAAVWNPCQLQCLQIHPLTGRLTTHKSLSQAIISDISSIKVPFSKAAVLMQ
jgi:hypothetical protein